MNRSTPQQESDRSMPQSETLATGDAPADRRATTAGRAGSRAPGRPRPTSAPTARTRDVLQHARQLAHVGEMSGGAHDAARTHRARAEARSRARQLLAELLGAQGRRRGRGR